VAQCTRINSLKHNCQRKVSKESIPPSHYSQKLHYKRQAGWCCLAKQLRGSTTEHFMKCSSALQILARSLPFTYLEKR